MSSAFHCADSFLSCLHTRVTCIHAIAGHAMQTESVLPTTRNQMTPTNNEHSMDCRPPPQTQVTILRRRTAELCRMAHVQGWPLGAVADGVTAQEQKASHDTSWLHIRNYDSTAANQVSYLFRNAPTEHRYK